MEFYEYLQYTYIVIHYKVCIIYIKYIYNEKIYGCRLYTYLHGYTSYLLHIIETEIVHTIYSYAPQARNTLSCTYWLLPIYYTTQLSISKIYVIIFNIVTTIY